MATKMLMIIRSNSGFFKFNMRGNLLSTKSLLGKTPFPFSARTTFSAFSLHSNSFCSNVDYYEQHSKSIYQKVANLDDALKLFDQMSQRRPFPSIIKFNQLLHSLTKMKHYSQSVDLFKQMCVLRVPVDNYTMNIVIKCFCQLHRTNDSFMVLGFCFRRGISPDLFTFNTLLNGLVGEERVLGAEIFFKKLIKDKLCEPDVVMYNTMIKGLCKIGNNIIARQLLRLMDERGCKPDVVTYNNIIDSLCKDQMIDDAFKLLKEMVFEKGISPNVITYNCLIDGFCNLGRWDEVSKMLQEMLDVGISPDMHTYNILVDAYCKEGKVEEAEDAINIMLERGIVPDIVTYNSIIDGYCLQGEMSKAKAVFDSMVFRDVIPNVVTYNSLLNGYWKNLKIDEAMLLFHKMNEKGLKPDAVTYNTMLWGLFRVGNCGAARKLFDEMRAKGLKPNECTYRVILEGLCNNNLIEDALSLFHLRGDSKLNSCINVYNILIDGASKCGKLDIARVLFQDLTNQGLLPDVQTYTVMIGGYCKEGLVCDAKQLFLKMDESECPPNNVTYNVLLQGYLRNQYHDDIEMLFHEMEGRHYSLDASTLSLLLDQIAAGLLDSALLELISNEVGEQFVNHFKKFLGESIPVRKLQDIDELFKVKLTQDEALSMTNDVSDGEIKRAMFQIDDNKAPGPDGFSSHFYKKAWDTIGGDICKAVKDSFHKGKILSEINSTVIALVPKIQTHTDVLPAVMNIDNSGSFKYHFGCEQISITHVCFADDLLMFCHGDVESLKVIKETIEEFGTVSGLLPNYNKSTIIFGGVNEKDRQSIFNVVPFRVEKLPVKYLGGPLVTKRIGVKDCKNLVDKVRNRTMSWKNKCLTYAELNDGNLNEGMHLISTGSAPGLQLVASVLESIHVYWATIFLLPQTIINDINGLLKGFLWNQDERASGRAKVAWKNLCKTKTQGGLGLKDLGIWNKDLIIEHLWHVAIEKDSLWVKWVSTYKLKKEVRQHLVTKVGNGDNNTSMWFDNWAGIGAPSDFVSYRDLYDARLKANLRVSEFAKGNNEEWLAEWMSKLPMIYQLPAIALNKNHSDVLMWKRKDGTIGEFSVSQAYYDLQNASSEEKLTTQDKVRRWGSYDMMVCPLCYDDMDSHGHLFFKCEFANNFWRMIKKKIKFQCADMEWQDLITKLSGMQNGNSIGSIFRRLCLAACVYLIWQERNNRVFRDEKRSNDNLFTIFNNIIKWRSTSLKVKKTQAVLSIAEIWDIKLNTSELTLMELFCLYGRLLAKVISVSRALYLGVFLERDEPNNMYRPLPKEMNLTKPNVLPPEEMNRTQLTLLLPEEIMWKELYHTANELNSMPKHIGPKSTYLLTVEGDEQFWHVL
uniref:Pentatricopeptide repeat-containing protein At1g63330-like n=1 Tax=Tanacetum cinerariifolium TaxID=118510 RepID=A0A6L2JPK2_TANCI|nr:pentatricopeptide repeat-containing protein At1g63330-like [Tanacetum cinerariifolium]